MTLCAKCLLAQIEVSSSRTRDQLSPITRRLSPFYAALREHRHAVIVVVLLTLALTFPTIIYVFETDVFWLPTGNGADAYVRIWDVWYAKQYFAGIADPYFTNFIFYPEGVSLALHPLGIPYVAAVNAINLFLPLSNAFSLAFILVICSSALAAYFYLQWLFRDKWIALFGALVFGFSPHVAGLPGHPDISFMAPVPLLLYCFHRGVREIRPALIIAAGLLAGIAGLGTLYLYVIVAICLGLYALVFALARWRDRRFWLLLFLLAAAFMLSSSWRLYPIMQNRQAFEEALDYREHIDYTSEALSFFINHNNPWTGPLLDSIVDMPRGPHKSYSSYLGYLPLLLCCFGLVTKITRRKTLPWALLCALFLVLRLGSHPTINGIAYPDILLPKHYLKQIAPFVFEPFTGADLFMMGALLPFAVLTCYGLVALQRRIPSASKPIFILALVLIVAFEYYIPVSGKIFPSERLAYLDWLSQENEHGGIRLINLPMGRRNSKYYNLFQALSGFPHAEGAISRTPDSAFNYIRSNRLLNAWRHRRPIRCDMMAIDDYLAGLTALEEDGFSHVVYHRFYGHANAISQSFDGIRPSYHDKSVSIFRLSDLRASCPRESEIQHQFTSAFANLLRQPAFLDTPQGTAVVFPPTPAANDHFRRYLRHFAQTDRAVVNIGSDEEGRIKMRSSEFPDADSSYNLESEAAVWLVNSAAQIDAAETRAYKEWFAPRFKFCARHYEDGISTIDLYLRKGIPCSAIDDSSAFEVHYEDGLRLRNASYEIDSNLLRFFLAWEKDPAIEYGFSLQFYDDGGQKVHQYDHVIGRSLLAVHEFDASPLREGAYSVRLIVYDFETHEIHSGTVSATGQRFKREFEVAQIEG